MMEIDSAAAAAAAGTGLIGGGAGVAVTDGAPALTIRSDEPKLLPASAISSVVSAAAAASATTTTTTTSPGEDHAIDATTYGIQQQQRLQPTVICAEQQQQQQQQKQQPLQAQALMLKVTGTKDKEKSHKRKKNMDTTNQGPPPTAIIKAENTPDVSACVTGDLRDDDDDNDEDDDRLLMQEYDPERLKAFNMFVRLFVDENLDRVAPISKQPKEKIQAILEACDRQFPEFHHRSRKRIRTYLKSCRRMRRSKGVGDGKQIRPTLPHLTSAAAETILARACENESNNAKRMRMGLEPLPATEMVMTSGQAPVPAALPQPPPPPTPAVPAATPAAPAIAPQPMPNPKPSPRSKLSLSPHSTAVAITPGIPLPLQKPLELTSQAGSRSSPLALAQMKPAPPTPLEMAHSSPMRQPSPKVAHRPVEPDHVLMQGATLGVAPPESELPLAYVTNGSGAKAHVGHTFEREIHPFQNEAYPGSASSVLQSNEQQQNGPTDLSMKKETAPPLSKSHLNPEEVATIKQLIAGYRESAAFLCRSADELQQLIMQHN